MNAPAKTVRRSPGTVLLNAPYMVWAGLFIIIPLFLVLYYALIDSDGNFTLNNLKELGNYTDVIFRSFWYSIIATVICLVVAYPFVYVVCKFGPTSKKLTNMFVTLPMWINLLIKTYCLTTLMDNNGLINQFMAFLGFGRLPLLNNTGAVIFGMVYNYLPYMILPIFNVMSRMDNSLMEAAEDLGCSPMQRLRRVVLPLSMPGVISGIIMVFIPSVSTFYISSKMGGTENSMIGDLIERQIRVQNDLSVAAAISLLLMVVILVSMFVLNRFSDDNEGGSMLV
ncbi:MAG: ABC transporter permease [Clostridia bacterium]|nr:ABC transporter permease [Clostridia bacterium]MBR6553065.1 ABC transporter permease [Clostridia bacterium]